MERCLLEDKFPDLKGVEVGNCTVEILYEPEDIEKLQKQIVLTVRDIEKRTKEYKNSSNNDDIKNQIFWSEVTEDRSYFMANLSEYSSKLHLPYQKYLTAYAAEEDLNWLDNL